MSDTTTAGEFRCGDCGRNARTSFTSNAYPVPVCGDCFNQRVIAAAADAADADADAARRLWLTDLWWYCRPRYLFWRSARYQLAGLEPSKNPWLPIIEMYRMGCFPIGYVDGEFCVWCPPVEKRSKEAA